MKKFLIGLGIAALLFGGAVSASATMVQTQWTATLDSIIGTSIASNYFAINDTFTVTATYDDAGIGYNVWGDGADGQADFGSNDDTNMGFSSVYGAWTSFSNADFLVSNSNWNSYLSDAGHWDSFQNISKVGIYGSPHLQTQFDGVRLYTRGGGTPYFRIMEMSDDASASDVGGFTVSSVFTTPIGQNPVPEPATMLLFGLGLLGLAGVSRRKK